MSYTKDRSVYIAYRHYNLRNTYSPSQQYVTTGYMQLLGRTLTGERLANWKELIATGQNATTALTARWASLDMKPFYAVVRYTEPSAPWIIEWSGYAHVANLLNYSYAWNVPNSQADNRAKAKFLSDVRKAYSTFAGGVFLGELGETLRMLRRPAAGLQDLIKKYLGDARRLKNGRRRPLSLGDYEKALADLWLEQAFGWIPLMLDINDAKKAYDDLMKDKVIHISEGGKDFAHSKGSDYYTIPACPGYVMGNCTYQFISTDIVRYRGAVIARAATTARDKLARFGFSPLEFIPTAWELLPWSFLIDYFANIGDVLEAVVTNTTNLAWVNKTTIHEREKSVLCRVSTEGWNNAYDSHSDSPGTARHYVRDITRTKIDGSSLMPTLQLKIPSSINRLTNMLALLGSANSIHPQRHRP